MLNVSKHELNNYLTKLLPDSNESVKNLVLKNVVKNQEYKIALMVYNSNFDISPQKLNIIYKFLTDVIIIDSLIVKSRQSLKDNFSNTGALLLGKSRYLRKKIQGDLGTVYSIRNGLVHNFSLPKYDEDFNRFFNNNLENALKKLELYSKLILLRLIKKNYELVDLQKLVENSQFNLNECLYDQYIISELEKIFPLDLEINDEIDLDLILGKSNSLVLGVDTLGGFTEKINYNLLEQENYYENFYKDEKRFIPSNTVWNEVMEEVQTKVSSINQQYLEKITILTKTHLSIVFIIGFHLDFNWKFIYFEFNDELTQLLREYPIRVEDVLEDPIFTFKKDSNRCFFGLSFKGDIIDIFENKISINTEKDSKLIFKPKMKTLNSMNQVFSALDMIKKNLRMIKKNRNITELHVIIRIPTSLAFLFGNSIKKFKFNKIVLYERGKIDIDQEDIKYYPVLTLQNDS